MPFSLSCQCIDGDIRRECHSRYCARQSRPTGSLADPHRFVGVVSLHIRRQRACRFMKRRERRVIPEVVGQWRIRSQWSASLATTSAEMTEASLFLRHVGNQGWTSIVTPRVPTVERDCEQFPSTPAIAVGTACHELSASPGQGRPPRSRTQHWRAKTPLLLNSDHFCNSLIAVYWGAKGTHSQ